MQALTGLLLTISAITTMVRGQGPYPPMPPPPHHQLQPPPHHQMQPPPPPYNLYGPINPYAASTTASMMYPPPGPPQQMVPPPLPHMPYATGSYAYPMMAAAAPYPSYGVPPPAMYGPPYQTYSGAGPSGDPFTNMAGNGMFNAKALTQLLGLKKKR